MFDKYSEHSSPSPTITPRFQHKTRFWRIYNKSSIISAINRLQNWVPSYFANRSNFVSNTQHKNEAFPNKVNWQVCALPYSSSWGTLLEEGKNSTPKAQQREKRPQLWRFWTGLSGCRRCRIARIHKHTTSSIHLVLRQFHLSILTAKGDTLSSRAARLCFYWGKRKSETAAISMDSSSVFRRT